ncbi:selenocysteine-specific translation elongation factor [Brachybacterium hainanense]|uniref:SelB C-terminal domain-containing protein n=1 Tax=Brachybacterium hainanense TaxID=1541174 RepID=A0ABV6REY2_9MICO
MTSRSVVATAGHVDHGKSALVRALTGIEPDRWEEERRRGLTIDLGFAWTRLPSGREVSFVDVPGHERFLANMLAGLGPAPVVCFVIAADAGWQAQSSDHRDAVAALGIDRGILALTRADLAAPGQAEAALARARQELAGTGLAGAPAVVTSARTGEGLAELASRLDQVLAAAPVGQEAPLRLWIDRAFSIAGAGAVVTGTLAEGALRLEDRLVLHTSAGSRPVQVRGLQGHGDPVPRLGPVTRAAANLRGIEAAAVSRGDVLLTPDGWHLSDLVDVRRRTGAGLLDAPRSVSVHVGTASVPARLRPLGPDHARLQLGGALPLRLGDRMVLRGGDRGVLAGVQVLDADPPALTRRGDGSRRAAALAAMPEQGDLGAEVARRAAVPRARLRLLGHRAGGAMPASVLPHGRWLVDREALAGWVRGLRDAVRADRERDPLSAGIPRGAATDLLGLPDPALLDLVLATAQEERPSLLEAEGRISCVQRPGFGAAEPGLRALEERLARDPFRAPEAEDLAQAGLGPRELAAAERAGRLLRLTGQVVLLPDAPALAMRELAALPQPFTLSRARQALRTTRRVAVPLLEHLDARGWTRRIDAGHRQVVR